MAVLHANYDMSRDAGLTLAAAGMSHEFDNLFTAATIAFNATHDATRAAVERFFMQRGGPVHH